MFLKLKTWLVPLWKRVTKRKEYQSDFQVYEIGKIVGNPRVIVFKNEDEVALFKLEQERERLREEIKRIDDQLKPWEEEIIKRYKKLWNC